MGHPASGQRAIRSTRSTPTVYVPLVRWRSTRSRTVAVTLLLATGCASSLPSGSLAPAAPHSPSLSSPSPSPIASPTVDSARATHTPRFHSIGAAVAFIKRRADVPVVLPAGMPRSIALSPKTAVYRLVAQVAPSRMLSLVFGKDKHLLIEYGSATFDGCGPGPDARNVHVAGVPAVIEGHRYGSSWWTQLIWPATLAHPLGRYGLSGSLPPGRMLRMAQSMQTSSARQDGIPNC